MARRLPASIEAGELRHRIQIVKPSGTQDAMGGVSQDPSQWTVVRTCWASIETWNGGAVLAASEFISTTTKWITIRHPRNPEENPTAQMYVWFKKRTFQIQAVLNPTEQNKILVLVCNEINDSAQQTAPPPVE